MTPATESDALRVWNIAQAGFAAIRRRDRVAIMACGRDLAALSRSAARPSVRRVASSCLGAMVERSRVEILSARAS